MNRLLHEIRTLKRQNRIIEQQAIVVKLKEKYWSIQSNINDFRHSIKNCASVVFHSQGKELKGTSRAKLKKAEFINFLMQDTISFSNPLQKVCWKTILLHTWDDIYRTYLEQEQFHKHGVLSKSSTCV